MQLIGGQFRFSASDLMRFSACRHATALDRAYALGEGPQPGADSEEAVILQTHGDAHEISYLANLKASGIQIAEISRSPSVEEAVAETRRRMAEGAEVIYQGALLSGAWGGWSDFLERVERPSRLGGYSYEVADTKLKRKPDPKHLLQLVLYSDLLAEVQGVMPRHAHIVLGNGERVSFRLADYEAYARRMRLRLEAFVAQPEETRPEPVPACSLCRWAEHCQSRWDAEDSLFNVANITRQQAGRLEAAGIRTLAGLAQATDADRPRRMAVPTFERLRAQARLQQVRKSGVPAFELRPLEPGKGFARLPHPQEGDVFYDIEGDPYYEGGLEYLHGIWADGQFTAFWAHDHVAEKKALEQLLAWLHARFERYPQARIYHYAPYEVTALKRLTMKYGVGEALLDRFLREQRFVDLYAVVRGGLIVSERNYSIKSLEVFYGVTREGEVKTAGGSVVAYEKWRETQDEAILKEIEDYNRIDCESTRLLRDWLVSIRPDMPWPVLEPQAEEAQAEEEEAQALRAALAATNMPEERQRLLFDLASFHKREAKPAWWAMFDSFGKETDDLIDSADALGGLTPVGEPYQVKKSVVQAYEFPPQETKIRSGDKPSVPWEEGSITVSVEMLDPARRRVEIKVGEKKAEVLASLTALHPASPLDTDVIADAVSAAVADYCGPREMRAVQDLLERNRPRFRTGARTDVLEGRDTVEGMINAVLDLDNSVLPVQGPPGTGKTYVTARAIVALVRAGKRVGVASNSHEAIKNVLLAVEKAREEDAPWTLEPAAPAFPDAPRGSCEAAANTVAAVNRALLESGNWPIVHRCPPHVYDNTDTAIGIATSNKDVQLELANVVGGTAFYFSREENRQVFDVLFVDEAGQVSLANLVAMATAARNLVLVGDPCQLPQVIQGAHPHPANLSCLEWMLGDDQTIAPDRGIFLGVSRRMHPQVCGYISNLAYEGRLESHADCSAQAIHAEGLPQAGAHLVPVLHEGNAQRSDEEIRAIQDIIAQLRRGTWTDKEGVTRPVLNSDIIVVAPYNVQVNALREALPDDIRVGTVDKFQGQEAPVCLVSMTTSSGAEAARGLDFLLSLNRMNVAVSRAKGLALVFASPRLLEAPCNSVEDMRLVNALCALADRSEPVVCGLQERPGRVRRDASELETLSR